MPLPGRTTKNTGTQGFVGDASSLERVPGGRMIDWTNVTAGVAGAVALPDGRKVLPAGCVVGELLGSGAVSPRVVTTNPAFGILETDAIQDSLWHASTGVGILTGGVLMENLLPDATGGPPKVLPGAMKTELAAAGCTFKFYEYQDVR